jgi:hypothetical protein
VLNTAVLQQKRSKKMSKKNTHTAKTEVRNGFMDLGNDHRQKDNTQSNGS